MLNMGTKENLWVQQIWSSKERCFNFKNLTEQFSDKIFIRATSCMK